MDRFRLCAMAASLIAATTGMSLAQTFATLATFDGKNGQSPTNAAGRSFVLGPDGNLYGTARDGGANQQGVVFRLTPGGTLTAIYSFTGQADGGHPVSGLILAADGNLYGTTPVSIFKVTPGGTFTTLYSTRSPAATLTGSFVGLVQSSDGNFYGVSDTGGTFGQGAVFKITPTGTLSVSYSFNGISGNGSIPGAPLIQGSDGNFYGTTTSGGGSFFTDPIVFRITPSGAITKLATLSFGSPVVGPLLQASDGNFYGALHTGSGAAFGTIFKMTPGGAISIVYTFACPTGVCTNGSYLEGGLIQGKDGNFYGTADDGGANERGVVYQLTLGGSLTVLHSFCGQTNCPDGYSPQGTLLQTSDGTLYGLACCGGTTNYGTAFSLKLPPPAYTCTNTGPVVVSSVNSASAYGNYSYFASGSWLEIKGSNLADPKDPRIASGTGQWASADFNGSSAPTSLDGISVTINNKPAYVWYLSPTQLNVQAPQDSATGSVAITVTNCKATSSVSIVPRQNLAPGLLAPPNYSSGGIQYMVATFASDGAYVLNTSLGASFGLNSRPAKPGDLIVAYGVGFGDVTPGILPGTVVGQANQLVNPVTFSFGSTPASLSYSGLAGSFVGLYEFFINVPAGLADGDYQINVSQNGTLLPQTLYLTIKK